MSTTVARALLPGAVVLLAALALSTGRPSAQPVASVVINGVDFVHVPAGPFTMGTPVEECVRAQDTARAREYCATWESPPHRVTLPAFYIMRTEVTIAQYDRFVRATGARRPEDRRPRSSPGTPRGDEAATGIPFSEARRQPDEPVTGVTWAEADAFCAWLGRGTPYTTRLPTEAEWEKAARATDGRVYPWGPAFDGRRLNFADVNATEPWRDDSVNDGFADLAPVGSFPGGAGPYGALDMAGNASEWVGSLLWPYPYVPTDGRESKAETRCTADDLKGCRVYRGGSYRHSSARTRAASRVIASYLDTRFVDVGLRCAAGAGSR